MSVLVLYGGKKIKSRIEFECNERLWCIVMNVNLNAQKPRTLELQQLWET